MGADLVLPPLFVVYLPNALPPLPKAILQRANLRGTTESAQDLAA